MPKFRYLHAADRLGVTDLVIKWPGGADSAPLASYFNDADICRTKLWGGIVLDRTVGGLNPTAVEKSAEVGGKFVWLPTVDAVHHRRINDQSIDGAVSLFDSRSRPVAELTAILERVAEFGQVLGTGHISPDETEAVIELAVEKGVRRIIVNHPLLIGADTQALLRMTRHKAVTIEHCYVPDHEIPFDVSLIVEAIDEVAPDQTVVADFGDFGREKNIADALVERGVSPDKMLALTGSNAQLVLAS
ncbi:MAG: DUF6282 family protein [Erythrobacter sp.]|nr:DUF6282 family protein [Erythrobacter sp.]